MARMAMRGEHPLRLATLPLWRQLIGSAIALIGLALVTVVVSAFGSTAVLSIAALSFVLLIVVVSIVGGLWPALVGAVAAGLLLNWFFVEPLRTVAIGDARHAVTLVVFVLVGGLVSLVVGQSEARLVQVRRNAGAASRAEALEVTDSMRTALLAAVGHDLRTPLASATASVASLAADDVAWTPEQRDALLSTASASLTRLERLLDDLLDRSRIESGVLATAPEQMAIGDAVSLALDELGSRGDAVTLLSLDTAPDIVADPVLVQRIVVNLVGNAVLHASGSPIEIGWSHADDRVALLVVDHGPGVDDARLQTILEPYQRLDDATTGTGLGLSISVGFAEAMDGSLQPEPTAGGGLTMRLELPAAPSAAAAPARPASSEGTP